MIQRRLGEGGMGVVFEALDITTNVRVALKALPRPEPAAIYKLKREFRALTDVMHDNLVQLHELFCDEGEWFFTMELLDAVPFSEYVRQGASVAWDATISSDTGGACLDDTVEASAGLALSKHAEPLREPQLRDGLRQLARGITAIHAAGKLHCDLKPSNVLVTKRGRVKILDFGLASDQSREGVTQTLQRGISGTPAYMAPEQARGEVPTPASDWYAFGVILYEALSGKLPFMGTVQDVLVEKQRNDPFDISVLAASSLGDLADLCMALLRRDPALRPSGAEVIERLGASLSAPPSAEPDNAEPLVGGAVELSVLIEALAAVRKGATRTVLVRGESGAGKTTLLERFLRDAARESGGLVLRGRCYEREDVPFKAFDGIVDALTRHLSKLSAADAAGLLPRDIHTLARMFPVLRRVPAVATARSRVSQVETPLELRRLAFAALRELFQRLGDRQPLVVFIDDLHWGDVDGAHVLSSLLTGPDSPVFLLLGAYRGDEMERSDCLATLRADGNSAWACAVTEVELAPRAVL